MALRIKLINGTILFDNVSKLLQETLPKQRTSPLVDVACFLLPPAWSLPEVWNVLRAENCWLTLTFTNLSQVYFNRARSSVPFSTPAESQKYTLCWCDTPEAWCICLSGRIPFCYDMKPYILLKSTGCSKHPYSSDKTKPFDTSCGYNEHLNKHSTKRMVDGGERGRERKRRFSMRLPAVTYSHAFIIITGNL